MWGEGKQGEGNAGSLTSAAAEKEHGLRIKSVTTPSRATAKAIQRVYVFFLYVYKLPEQALAQLFSFLEGWGEHLLPATQPTAMSPLRLGTQQLFTMPADTYTVKI